ncbi:hypothetical protein E5F05_06355 [Deinococcus metallilatus]|uniref:DUF2089 domain-containing protein n=2 Tax=Deinococcus TaxID=1298 RepID=A0AAJ5F5Z8_9DEIO|nr:hypothetical protein [Deinococcus metallilatus]MBB5294566.1 hypothetical protein [Deinococcus metallilatus]QBY07609.1 hypothetical protein E5F05_06355 [Deinococcus metallilatus]RXJ14025.1 hypothetical protein ERJ73_05190 [Deinococcus metallilatus]TLK29990.1 hypothetical protein FCS05_05505 [Deinococcus metallilatus]GMA15779.1 hypothetical protein GCM10025871_21100 [Deinococcus metallilatus]
MKEKVKRLLDLVRAGRLSLEDAGPLLAALNPRLALTDSDRELVASLLAREDMDTGQVAEHLLLLRGVRDVPQPPSAPRIPRVVVGGRHVQGVDGLVERLTGGIDGMVDRITDSVDRAFDGAPPRSASRPASARILRVEVESSSGDEYTANLPVSLAPHLDRLIPPHGREALERAGLSIEALQLLIEAGPPPGDLIDAEDSSGNSVRISLK